MTRRRLLVSLGLGVLLALAVAGVVRSAAPGNRTDPVQAVAAGLRCPACQGESVAESRSPIAASMRQVIAEQEAQGRSPQQIRRWFVDRYGQEVLAQPPLRGPALLVWAVPAVALLGGVTAARRTLRSRRPDGDLRHARLPPSRDRPVGLIWWLAAGGLVALVATVAVAADRLAPTAPQQPPADAAAVAVRLAQDLEGQQRYDAAAQMYREALNERPEDAVRLRLAFALLRAADAAGAERTARELLGRSPDSPDALLVLGLAQRTTRPPEAPATLRRFLSVAPGHPAAAEIRRLLGS
ncbi:cytochrome c-type biogenesis protein CcmH [Micromonospora sp. NPDC005299]|uniref:cytochrome c-type biogenesis protein CcmH n=1 Tax=Micromonospora sp. NPDC005299 TaxID=3364231 RepID=UPI0036939A11